jgi:hypothetical protein
MREADLRPLLIFGAWAGIVGGALRIAAAFVPYAANDARLETLYAVIDLGLLFGLIAIYLAHATALGAAGLLGFVIAAARVASIVGPDTQAFGVDFYRLGGGAALIGLMVISVQALRTGRLRAPAMFWLVGLALAIAPTFAPAGLFFVAMGVAFGAGFVTAGLAVLRGDGRRVAPLAQRA